MEQDPDVVVVFLEIVTTIVAECSPEHPAAQAAQEQQERPELQDYPEPLQADIMCREQPVETEHKAGRVVAVAVAVVAVAVSRADRMM